MSELYSPFYPLIQDYERQLQSALPLPHLGLRSEILVQTVLLPFGNPDDIQISALRADLLHSQISGNKWFKLKYNLLQAKKLGKTRIVSFGGAWSNHLHAVAHACNKLELDALALVRGQELTASSNPMLQDASDQGMQFQFLERARYRALCAHPNSQQLVQDSDYVIPEGGDNWLGMLGASTMLHQAVWSDSPPSHVVTAMGTGCSFAGLRMGLPNWVELIGVSALKGRWPNAAMTKRLQTCLIKPKIGNWRISTDHHRGRFGRIDQDLVEFCQEFADLNGFSLDYLYTGKAMMALQEWVSQKKFKAGSHILFIHSGGVQGNRSVLPVVNNKSDVV